ncbi:glucuronate isomerase [Escherichia coli]|uniref:Glucuronate isomerase n=1 Tax=Escherichia coli TaxID=562 RepID=A0A376LBG2_ECOLX|nr:glucuronate isomerase [Escherichia coli]
MTPFMTEDFLLDTEFARRLYHDYAKDRADFRLPLPFAAAGRLRKTIVLKNLYDIWFEGRSLQMARYAYQRVAERLCTGDAF